ncbi:MAG TPA: hypothetical protein VN778_04140 [Verrucomicrobiae bacterium]|nr:hypothetical protein [Verrucomicrobiae bacterium]
MKGNYTAILLEEIRDQYRTVLEAVGDMQTKVARIPVIEQDIAELKTDMKAIKFVLTEQNRTIDDH